MPKELTHWILAERSLAGLDPGSRLHGVIHDHRALYLAGAVLPDTLLHLVRGRHATTALALGHNFHDTGDNSYLPLIRAEEICGNALPPPLLACLLGVLSHMQGDIVFHPFVYALGGSREIGPHYRVETLLDVHFVSHGAVPPVRRLAPLVTPESRDTLVRASTLLFDPRGELPRQVLEQALLLHCRLQALYDSAPWKLVAHGLSCLPVRLFRQARELFYPFGLPEEDEFATRNRWRHPVNGTERYESADDLADEAARRTVDLFTRIEAQGSLKAALSDPPGENLLTGLYGTKAFAMERLQV